MPRLGKGWKECGFDNSPPRPEPTERAKLEMKYGERLAAVNSWVQDGKVTWNVERDQWLVIGGVAFDVRDLLNDVTFANIALGVQAGGGSNG